MFEAPVWSRSLVYHVFCGWLQSSAGWQVPAVSVQDFRGSIHSSNCSV
jgi:hypothetical protein